MTEQKVDDVDTGRVSSWRLLAGNPVTVAATIILLVVLVIAVGAEWLAPAGINDVDVPSALRGPSGAHWFGTDELGRDVLSRVLVAVQASMEVAVVSVAFAAAAGITIGVVAGYRGGWVDTVFMRSWTSCSPSRCCCSHWRSWPSSAPASPRRCSRSASSTPRSSPAYPAPAPSASGSSHSSRCRAPWARATVTSWSATSCPTLQDR